MIVQCFINAEIWSRFKNMMRKIGYNVDLKDKDIMYGHQPKKDKFNILNLCIIIQKYCIYRSFINEQRPSFYDFQTYIKSYFETEVYIHEINSKHDLVDKWQKLYNII